MTFKFHLNKIIFKGWTLTFYVAERVFVDF